MSDDKKEVDPETAAEALRELGKPLPPADRSQRDVRGEAIAPGVADTSDRGDGQQRGYVVLSDAERAKGFVRPVRRSYIHVGKRPKFPTRPLTDAERERGLGETFACFEVYPESKAPKTGRYWTQAELESGCGALTTMSIPIAETYARDPKFYSGTFCCACAAHFPVGADGEFVWAGTDEEVGT